MTCDILMICGSLRAGSTNAAMLRTVSALAPEGISASQYDGLDQLPHFNPDADHDPLHPAVADLRHRIGAADAVLFSTPEYAGALPGSLKNLLDWTVGGVEICDRPAAWINTSTSPTGAVDAHESLRRVLGYTGADIVEAACVHIPVPRQRIDPETGIIRDPAICDEIVAAITTLATYAGNKGRAECGTEAV
jgi:NAD(P)H-dependent FMN reductase